MPWFWGQMRELAGQEKGSRVRQRLRPEGLLRLQIPLPGLDRQEQALRHFARVREALHVHQARETDLLELRSRCLVRLFNSPG